MKAGLPEGKQALVCPDGQLRHTRHWQSTALQRLPRNVMRLSAPPAGRLSGLGVNSDLAGNANASNR